MPLTTQDKSFWAMHIGMAVNNLLAVVQYVEKKFPKGKPPNIPSDNELDVQYFDDSAKIRESSIINTLKDKKTPLDKKRKIIRVLLRHLPFMRITEKFNETPLSEDRKKELEQGQIDEINKRMEYALSPEGVADALCYYTDLLYSLRNFYTHQYRVSPVSFSILGKDGKEKYPGKVCGYLHNIENIWTYNLRLLKQRHGYDEPTMLHLRKKVGKDKNRKCTCRFFIEEDEKRTDFTERGLAFFISLFLEKSYVAILFAKLDQLEKSERQLHGDSPEMTQKRIVATLKAYQTTTIRLPKVRMQTVDETTVETLGMDMLVELHKCPDGLFALLNDENRKKFRVNTGEEDKPDDERLFKRQSKRHENRFAILALNYLDRTEKFSSMCFHIDIGNYFFDCYEKGLIDGTKLEERRIGKRILTFQRIQDAIKEYKEKRELPEEKYWEATANETPPKEYRQDMLPQYRIRGNQIGLYFRALHKGFPKVQINGKETKNPKPDCWLSTYELPQLVFLATVGQAKQAQDLLYSFRKCWDTFLQKLINGEKIAFQSNEQFHKEHGIDTLDLPKELEQFVKTGTTRTSDIKKTMKESLGRMKKRAEEELRRFRDDKVEIKPGKSSSRYTAGRIAMILAKDLMKLQRPNEDKSHQGKLTPPNFQALQANLAMFNETKGNLPDVFKKAGLINNPAYPHPFLNELVNDSDFISLPRFFAKYLERKISFIADAIKSGDFDRIHTVIRLQRRAARQTSSDFIKELATKLLNEPMNLPRGLFAEQIETFIKEEFPTQFAELSGRTFMREGKEVNLPNNSTFLIQKYHEWNGDAWQWFYDLPWDSDSHQFKQIGKLFCKNQWDKQPFDVPDLKEQYGEVVKSLKKKHKTLKKDEQEKFTKRINSLDKHLKRLRQEKLQDILLFYIVKELLQIGNVKLSDIKEQIMGDDKENRYLFEQEQTLERKYTIADLPITLVGKMKVKNYGNFHRLTNDIRTPSLLRLLHAANKTNEFQYQRLQDDLDRYEEVRSFVFKKIHELEKIVLTRCPSLKKDNAGKEKDYVEFRLIVKMLSIPEYKKEALKILRNAFAHHYYPEFIYEPDDKMDKKTADYLTTFLEQQFRNKLVEKPLPDKLTDGKPATMARRVMEIAETLFKDALANAQMLSEEYHHEPTD